MKKLTAILTATMLVASIFAFSVVGSVDAIKPTLGGELKAIQLRVERIDIVHTTDLATKGEVISISFEPKITFNLLNLQSGILTALGISDLPEGFVTQIRIVVTEATITFNGTLDNLFVPGGVLKLNGVLIVPDGGDAVFDFDVEKSVTHNRHHGFILKPSIKFFTNGLDQFNDPKTGTSFGCGNTGLSLYQSFTPTASSLLAVEPRFRAGGDFPTAGVDTTVKIRSDSPTGTVLGTAMAFVPGSQLAGAQLLVRFNFSPAITVTPGDTFVIEWVSPAPAGEAADTILTWMGRTDNPYGQGNMFGCTGIPILDNDLNFRTIRPAP